MKFTFEGEVTSVTKLTNEKYNSTILWKKGTYSYESVIVPQRLELGQRWWVVVTDQDPVLAEVAAQELIESIVCPPTDVPK